MIQTVPDPVAHIKVSSVLLGGSASFLFGVTVMVAGLVSTNTGSRPLRQGQTPAHWELRKWLSQFLILAKKVFFKRLDFLQ